MSPSTLQDQQTSEGDNPLLDIVLVVFIHGFKGTDTTFGSFPSRLGHVLSDTLRNVKVECIVFPAYDTKGELREAVERFADWLTTLTVNKEVAYGVGAGRAKVVLCGHSMGGLLAADTLLEFVNTRPDKLAPLWPNIVACLAYDTPYLGLHPHVFKNSAQKVGTYVQTAREAASGLWSSWAAFSNTKAASSSNATEPVGLLSPPVDAVKGPWEKFTPAAYAIGGAVLAGAAAGTAYYRRSEIGTSYSAVLDHMKYVGNLWNEKMLVDRLDALVQAETVHGVIFRAFYTVLPHGPLSPRDRTFILLPRSSPVIDHFLGAQNNLANDEVQAHVGMFEPSTNDGYYELGMMTARLIREAVTKDREFHVEDEISDTAKSVEADLDDLKRHSEIPLRSTRLGDGQGVLDDDVVTGGA